MCDGGMGEKLITVCHVEARREGRGGGIGGCWWLGTVQGTFASISRGYIYLRLFLITWACVDPLDTRMTRRVQKSESEWETKRILKCNEGASIDSKKKKPRKTTYRKWEKNLNGPNVGERHWTELRHANVLPSHFLLVRVSSNLFCFHESAMVRR